MLAFSSYLNYESMKEKSGFEYQNTIFNFFAGAALEIIPPLGATALTLRNATAGELYIGLDVGLQPETAPWMLTKHAVLSLQLNPASSQRYFLLSPEDGQAVAAFQIAQT